MVLPGMTVFRIVIKDEVTTRHFLALPVQAQGFVFLDLANDIQVYLLDILGILVC